MRFKSAPYGWRDLRIEGSNPDSGLQVSIDTETTHTRKDKAHFISIEEDGNFAAFHMSVPELRKFAQAILKETEK